MGNSSFWGRSLRKQLMIMVGRKDVGKESVNMKKRG